MLENELPKKILFTKAQKKKLNEKVGKIRMAQANFNDFTNYLAEEHLIEDGHDPEKYRVSQDLNGFELIPEKKPPEKKPEVN